MSSFSTVFVLFSFLLVSALSQEFMELKTVTDRTVFRLSVGNILTIISSDPQNLLENIVVSLDISNKTATAYQLSKPNNSGQQDQFLSNPTVDYVSFKITNSDVDQKSLTGYVIIQSSSINIFSIPKDLSSIQVGNGKNLFYAPTVAGKTPIAKNFKGKQSIGYTSVPDDTNKIMFFNSSLFDVDSYDVVELPSGLFHFISSDAQTSYSISMGERISKTITSLTSSGVWMSEGFPTDWSSNTVQYTLQNPANDNVIANIKPFFNNHIQPAYSTNISIGNSSDPYRFDCVSIYDTTITSNRITNIILINTTGPYSIQYTLNQNVLIETSTKSSTTLQFLGIAIASILIRL